ncbi:MAG TPA: phosphoribosylanthranilate isomerase [Thermoanaerobaculia bacterium]|nr:phosphoribosylanthranilate isomerase [Thermoanaerobaculia bacterium]
MTKIKICGITNEDDALFCAERGADFLGFIFVPSSPRHVEPEKAGAIATRLRESGNAPKFVGVFQDASADYIREIAGIVGLDLAQLHGSESEDDICELGIPAIKTLHVSDLLPDTHAAPTAGWLLFDTYDERRAGGTGRRFDWSLLATYDRFKPFFLSGGLTPDNVVAAISLVRPDAIDVASGVEASPGVKDQAKVARLFERVRRPI